MGRLSFSYMSLKRNREEVEGERRRRRRKGICQTKTSRQILPKNSIVSYWVYIEGAKGSYLVRQMMFSTHLNEDKSELVQFCGLISNVWGKKRKKYQETVIFRQGFHPLFDMTIFSSNQHLSLCLLQSLVGLRAFPSHHSQTEVDCGSNLSPVIR